MFEGEEYLTMYPKLRKWVNECSECHTKGYKPSMLESMYPYPSAVTDKLRYYYKPLHLNEEGICEQCIRKSKLQKEDA